MKQVFLLCLFSFSISLLHAQDNGDKGRYRFLSIKGHSGRHLYTGQALNDELTRGYSSLEIQYGWQSKKGDGWEKYYGYPSYGIGWYSGYIGDLDIFGNPNALYGFISFPVVRRKRHDIQVEPAMGMTYNLNPYDPVTNQINDAIGSKFAVYFLLHAGGIYKASREIDVVYGVDLTHFSNGRTVTPNLGLNMYGLSLGARYHFNGDQRRVDNSLHPQTVLPVRPKLDRGEKLARIREDNISLYQAFGTVQNKRNAGTNHRYITSSTLLEYQHKFNIMHGVSIGFDAMFDFSAADTVQYPANTKQETFFPAVHAGYDFMFWKLSVKLQMAYHLTTTGRELKGKTFVRPAIRYEINPRLFAQAGLKTANGATADWIEVGIGYKPIYRKR